MTGFILVDFIHIFAQIKIRKSCRVFVFIYNKIISYYSIKINLLY